VVAIGAAGGDNIPAARNPYVFSKNTIIATITHNTPTAMIEPVERRTKKVKRRTTPSIMASTPADDAVSVAAFAAAAGAAAAAGLAAVGFATTAPLAFTHVCSSPGMLLCLNVEPTGHEGWGPNGLSPGAGVGLFVAKKALRATLASSAVSYIFPLNSWRLDWAANLFLVSSGVSAAKNWTAAGAAAGVAGVAGAAAIPASASAAFISACCAAMLTECPIFAYSLRR
jgi:hypothetical protein